MKAKTNKEMKRLWFSLVIIIMCIKVSAQDTIGDLNMLKEGTVIKYALTQQCIGTRDYYIYQMEVTEINEQDFAKEIKYLLSGFEQKRNGLVPFKLKTPVAQSMKIYKDEITIDGEFILNGLWRPQIKARSSLSFGHALTIPKDIRVGKMIKSDFLITQVTYPEAPYADPGGKDMVKYEYFRVTAEEDIVTKAGTFHCYKLEGTVSYYYGCSGTNIPIDSYQLWYCPSIGVVKMCVQFTYASFRQFKDELIIDEIIWEEN